MSSVQYELIRLAESYCTNAIAGVDIEAIDRNIGIQRESAFLSLGESFIVSLAHSLSDAVQSHADRQPLETLFIDDGFETLNCAVF